MSSDLESIARKNFCNSGYITHPVNERRTPWQFTSPPKTPFPNTDAVRLILLRRERALSRGQTRTSFLRNFLNAFLRR